MAMIGIGADEWATPYAMGSMPGMGAGFNNYGPQPPQRNSFAPSAINTLPIQEQQSIAASNYGLYQKNAMFPYQLQQQQMKTNALGSILGSFGHNGWTTGFMNSSSMNPYRSSVPAPNYGSINSVYTPQQISSEANAQRANLYAQAQNANRQYAMQAGAAGYSPMSPLTQFMTNTNNMRVAGNAAQNETNLRFNAAQANADAALKQQGVNANLYDAYSRALGLQAGQQNQLALGLRGQNLDLLHYLLGALG